MGKEAVPGSNKKRTPRQRRGRVELKGAKGGGQGQRRKTRSQENEALSLPVNEAGEETKTARGKKTVQLSSEAGGGSLLLRNQSRRRPLDKGNTKPKTEDLTNKQNSF